MPLFHPERLRVGEHRSGIAMILSKRLDIEPIRTLKMFYESQACANLHDRLYLYGDPYVADELMLEIQQQQ